MGDFGSSSSSSSKDWPGPYNSVKQVGKDTLISINFKIDCRAWKEARGGGRRGGSFLGVSSGEIVM